MNRISPRCRRSGEPAGRREPEAVNQDHSPLRDNLRVIRTRRRTRHLLESAIRSQWQPDGVLSITISSLNVGFLVPQMDTPVSRLSCNLLLRKAALRWPVECLVVSYYGHPR